MLSKVEIEQLIKDDNCNNYFLLNEILAIRDKTEEVEDYEICVNGYISVDVLNENIEKENKLKQLESEKQKLIEKLEEDKKKLTEELEYNITKREATIQLKLVDKYLQMLKGENNGNRNK